MPDKTAIVAALVIAAALTPATPAAAQAPTTPAAPITWHGCTTGPGDRLGAELDKAGAQCGEVVVPVDYRRPEGREITIALSRIKATDPARRRGVVLLNPGGPGGPAMELVLAGPSMPEIAARYDLVGMDPRFVGRSSPLRCAWNTDTFARSAGPDARSFRESVAFAKELARGCSGNDRELLRAASTRNTARDMDVVRAALGERKISYIGASYGTYLGAVYLQMFGSRADRFVLDSPVDPGVFGPGLLRSTAPALDAALKNWAKSAAGRELGEQTVRDIARAAERRPFRVGKYTVDGHLAPYLFFAHLYDDRPASQAEFAATVRTLRDAAAGRPVTPSPSLNELLDGLTTGSGAATDRAGTPVVCADREASRVPAEYYRDIQSHRQAEPLFGPLARNITPCAFWPVTPAEPATRIHNGSPALLLGSTDDPATPYAGQLAMRRALAGSRMVTLEGAYRHSVFLKGGACVDAAVRDYLLGGELPADRVCRS
ncbi:alpha/beta hydrolase fold [Amycolatopsis lurida]|uniref:alpha/beta hydrolase n=1 Tax=Amycolatopsis lurida TaxID=31959 RepID=UPI000557E571|nr:alpha/beta fold hydrolase [Amycolatopsis lurida]SEE56959.1 alpha/beta hydrolase fold [Amycolatopsis lurida]